MLKKLGLFFLAAVLCNSFSPSMPALADDTGFAYSHDLNRVRGKLCMSGHYHYGASGPMKTKRKAKREAMMNWQDFTAFEYGSDWASFRRSVGKKVECSRSGGYWSCNVSSRPCNRYRKPRG